MRNAPQYTDGILDVFEVIEDQKSDFPKQKLRATGVRLWYRELSVFDQLRYRLNEQGKEVTMKIRIPRYKGIDSRNWVRIDGHYHQVYNAAHLISKDGFPETELTLTAPQNNLEEDS